MRMYLKIMAFFLFLIIFLNLVPAKLPNVKLGECVELGANLNATSVNISIKFPNQTHAVVNDRMNYVYGDYFNYTFCKTNTEGEYIYSYYTDERGSQVDNSFLVTLSGEENDMVFLIADIIIICLIILFIYMLHSIYKKADLQKLDRRLIDSHNGDFGKTYIKGIGYGLMKNSFLWYYLLGWILLFFVKDLMYRFSSKELYSYLVLVLNIYSFGFLLTFAVIIGFFIRYFRDITDMIEEIGWGVRE